MSVNSTPTQDVVFVGAEIAPLIKTGGLADVVSALPKSLHALGQRIIVAVPYNENSNKKYLRNLQLIRTLRVPFGKSHTAVDVLRTTIPKTTIPLLLFKNNRFLSRGTVYASQKVWDPLKKQRAAPQISTAIRFIIFSQAIIEYLKQAQLTPRNIHLNDWHTAAIAYLAKRDPVLSQSKTILTVHNGQHTGQVSARYGSLLSNELSHQNFRLLDLGCKEADIITTVSKQYAKELLTAQYGNGLEKILRKRQGFFFGIVNGLDVDLFNPETDRFIPYRFSADSLPTRINNKLSLQAQLGFDVHPTTPLVGLVHRLDQQKGIDLVLKVLSKLLSLGVQCVIEGTGNQRYENYFFQIQKQFPSSMYFHNIFDEDFGRKIYAASDLFLMPSKFEPCGLSQLIAMRYGAVPIVRATGGLKNTVHEGRNGFVFTTYSATALWRTMQRALHMYYHRPAQWTSLMRRGMQADYSWTKSAKQYVTLYTAPKRPKR